MRSFNFLSNSYKHLADKYYKVCIRRERGYCRIGWNQSPDTDSFKVGCTIIRAGNKPSFSSITAVNTSFTFKNLLGDYA